MDYFKLGSRIAGAAAAAMVVYDAHNAGIKTSAENIKIRSSERLTDEFLKSRRMEDRSIITSKLKDKFFRDNADWNLPDKVNGVTGYFGGAITQALYDIIPAILATGALVSKKYPKVFGAGLALYGLKYIICDVMDIGRPNNLRTDL
ncbi:MAG: hypothetical protein KHX03_00065 [Clostridium sp.]|nr:hypothetical protein [Clostridium sp.]